MEFEVEYRNTTSRPFATFNEFLVELIGPRGKQFKIRTRRHRVEFRDDPDCFDPSTVSNDTTIGCVHFDAGNYTVAVRVMLLLHKYLTAIAFQLT